MLPLDERVVGRYVLRKQHLLDGSKASGVAQVVDDVVALHATSAETPYLSLFARVKRFRIEDLDRELYVKRSLIRLAAMRGTLFITSTESAPVLFQATRSSELQVSKWLRRWGVQASEVAELAAKLIGVLKGGAKTVSEIKRSLSKEDVRSLELRVGNDVYRMTNVNVVLNSLVSRGLVISEKGEGALRVTQANRYRLLEEVYPSLEMESVRPEDAKTMLIVRYVRTFGPVLIEDIVWWTGLMKTEVKNCLETVENELLSVEIDGFERDYVMLKSDYGQFARCKASRARSLVLLPYEDPYPKGYKFRDRLVDVEHEKKAFVGGGVLPTVLLDGRVVGTWSRDLQQVKGPVQLRFFARPERGYEQNVARKVKAAARLMTGRSINVKVVVEA